MKRKKGNADRLTAGAWWSRNRWSCVILAAALVLFIVVRMAAVTFEQPQPRGDEYAEYETGVVTDILSDSTEADTVADGGYRGEQLLLAQVRSGQYKGETMQVYNYVGPLYGQPLKVGQRAVLLISTYSDGSHTATVYEYDRAVGLAVTVGLFLLATVLVGGKVGAKSLVALAVTLVCLFWILIPLLMKGASTLLTVFLVCAYITVVTMVILGGVCRKTVCAALGTVAGTALALLFGLLSQSLLRIDGLRLTDVEPLLQLRQTGTPLGLRGLLVAGVVISALGAVMDVAMSISSALTEVHTVAPDRDGRALFRSGMNIGRDMVGTMTNTLILAFLGSGLSFIIYRYSLGLDPRQLVSAGLLVAVEEEAHAALGHEAPAQQQPDGEVGHHDAALHVQDARTVGLIPLHMEGHGGESSHREDGVVMPHDQNPLAAAAQLAVQVVAAFRLGDPTRPKA